MSARVQREKEGGADCGPRTWGFVGDPVWPVWQERPYFAEIAVRTFFLVNGAGDHRSQIANKDGKISSTRPSTELGHMHSPVISVVLLLLLLRLVPFLELVHVLKHLAPPIFAKEPTLGLVVEVVGLLLTDRGSGRRTRTIESAVLNFLRFSPLLFTWSSCCYCCGWLGRFTNDTAVR
jgi:hypothetical protein